MDRAENLKDGVAELGTSTQTYGTRQSIAELEREFRSIRGGGPTVSALSPVFKLSNARHYSRNTHAERCRKQFQIANTDLLSPVLKIRNETSIHPHELRHVDLCPLLLLAQMPEPFPETDTDVIRHTGIMSVGFGR